jgi:hypothetical protein
MQMLFLEGTKYTPKVIFDPNTGRFEISGRSLPEDTEQFYGPIHSWVKEYVANPFPNTLLVFNLEYFNTGSSRTIMELLMLFKQLPNAKVVWRFNADDDDMQEAGEQFAELVEIPFELKAN